MTIRLLNSGDEKLFAQCVIPNGEHEKYVERVLDSSRYWVLKIVNGQRHAFIGFGFSDRNDAFDFNACIQDFRKQFVDRETDTVVESLPMKDLSLKDGEKITLNLKNPAGSRAGRNASGSGGYAAGGGLSALAPPPKGGGIPVLAPPVASSQAVPKAAQDDF